MDGAGIGGELPHETFDVLFDEWIIAAHCELRVCAKNVTKLWIKLSNRRKAGICSRGLSFVCKEEL